MFAIHPARDAIAAEHLTLLLQNFDLTLRIGRAARSCVEIHYAQHTVVPRYENLLEATILNRSMNVVQRRIGHPIARYFMGLGT